MTPAQGALVLTLPGRDQQARIRREVAAILTRHAGRDRAIHRGTLARLVRENLGLNELAQTTLDRRVREALGELLDEGHRIVSDQHGIYIPLSAEEIAAGDKALAGNAFGALRRLATYRRTTLRTLLELLGQQANGLGER